MDRVSEWMREHDLEVYIEQFEEQGWDTLPVLLEMTESDIEMCIQKPGHKAKFKRALRYLKSKLENPQDSYQNEDVTKAAKGEMGFIAADRRINEGKVDTEQIDSENDSLEHQRAIDMDISNDENLHLGSVKAFCGDVRTIKPDNQGDSSIENTLPSKRHPETYDIIKQLERVQVEQEDSGNVESDDEMVGKTNKGLDQPNTSILFDGRASMGREEVDKSQHITELSETHFIPSPEEGTTENVSNVTIIKHSEHTSITDHALERRIPECDQVTNLKSQNLTVIKSFDKKVETYVETNAYKELKTVVDKHHWATLLGKAGDGKSTTAARLLLDYEKKGYEPLFMSSVRQWEALISSKPSTKQCVLIDDMFGSIAYDDKKAGDWLNEIERMDQIVTERNGDILVVCTSRRHIFTDVESKLYKCSVFRKASIVDMTDEKYKLSAEEKVKIIQKYEKGFKIKIEHQLIKTIKEIDPPHGFPHCVKMFCTNSFLREKGIHFFENPEEFVQQELHNFKDNDPMKFLVLLLVLYKQNHLDLSNLEETIEHPDEDVVKFFKFTGIPLSTASTTIINAVKAVTNTYLKQSKDGYYTFTHASLKENVSTVYISLNSSHATKVLDLQQIITYMNRPTANVKLPVCALVDRITTELLLGNADTVSLFTSWNDQTFVGEWISFVTGAFEYSKALSKPILSLITHLLENRINDAVIAILKSEPIMKTLSEDEKWIESLEYGLVNVCSTTHNIDVVKAIVAALADNSAHMMKINGTTALEYALRASATECAQYLVENTEIIHQEKTYEENFKNFRPYIERCVKVRDLIAFFKPFTMEQKEQLIHMQRTDPKEAIRQAFDYIQQNTGKVDIYQCLIDALKEAEYEKVVKILEGQLIPDNDKNRMKINDSYQHIYQLLSTGDVIAHLCTRKVLNASDVEEIRVAEKNYGRAEAATELLFILPRRARDWFKQFIEALIACQQTDLAAIIDKDLSESLQQRKVTDQQAHNDWDVQSTVSISDYFDDVDYQDEIDYDNVEDYDADEIDNMAGYDDDVHSDPLDIVDYDEIGYGDIEDCDADEIVDITGYDVDDYDHGVEDDYDCYADNNAYDDYDD